MENKLELGNCFQKEIYEYLKEYHPYLFLNIEEAEKIIIDRATKAEHIYSNEIKEGKNHIDAMNDANLVLHEDLEFSPTTYLQSLYEEHTGKILDENKTIKIYIQTKHIFDKYGKDIEGNDKEPVLINELIQHFNEFA